MYKLGKRNQSTTDTNELRYNGECMMGCIVTCDGLCGCTGSKAAYTADAVDGGLKTSVYGRNAVAGY